MKVLYFTIFYLSVTTAHALNPDGFESFTHLGHVYAQTVVTTDDGKPLWAEYNAQGGHSRMHQLDGMEGQVLPAMQVQSFFKLLNDFENQYPEGIEVFTGSSIGGQLLTATGESIQWPALPANSVTVVFPAQSQRFTTDGEQLNTLILPIDIRSLSANQVQGQLTAFFNEHGQFVISSPERLGRMTAFYLKDGAQAPADAVEYQPASSLINLSSANYQLLNPIAGVPIEAMSGYIDGFGVTDATGFYRLQGRLSPCPGFASFPEVSALAKLNYASFNPRSTGRLPYYISKTSYNSCVGYGAFAPGYILAGLSTQQDVRSMVMLQPDNITRLNYPVAIQVINGSIMVQGVSIAGTTQYSVDNSANTQYTMVQDDYDGDGEIDQTVRGHLDAQGNFQPSADGDRYGVFFSGSPRADEQPNIIRVIDILPNVNHQGLLSSLSVEDFQKTDLLVFRASTGQLITQRVGLSADEIDTSEQRAYFQMAIRGPEDNSTHAMVRAQNTGWQANGNDAAASRTKDSIRPGEHVHIVAINRPTGYIGITMAELTPTAVGGDISVKLDAPIILSPPNLQIWASRRVQAHGLLSNSDEERYTISNEGAATTDDTLLEIHTQWLDQDGTPLPVGLKGYGYTGRLTKQIEHTQVRTDVMDNQVNEFSIDPGRHMQVIRFDQQQPYHHYVQVNGYPSSEQNDFSSGEHTGALAHRPSRYVPIKAPLYDEQGSVNDRLALLNTDYSQPKYHWVYRPELSFSVVDIKVNDILLKEHNDGATVSQSLLDSTAHPVITGQEDIVEILFHLIGSEYDRITPMEGEQHYIFALGDNEIEVRIDKSDSSEQQITFSDLDYLTGLKASDYLTLSLYLNQDSHNLLWNWGFTTRDVDLDEDNNNGTDLPDRSLLEEHIESITQHSGKRNFLNNGDVNNNGIPDFAEFEYTIVPEQASTPTPELATHHFVPIVIEIPQHVDLTVQDTTLKFYYAGSDPQQVAIKKAEDDPSGNKKDYEPAPGNMRLWAKDASEKRDPKGYGEDGGDYLVPEQAYQVTDLLKSNALANKKGQARTLVIYAEAIRTTENRGAVLTTVLNYTYIRNGKTVVKEERLVNGLTNLENPFQAVAALPQDTDLDLAYSVNLDSTPPAPQITLYSIGGVRLKLTYNLNSLTHEDKERLDSITWTFNQAGRLCQDLKVYANNRTPDGQTQCEEMKGTEEEGVFTAEHSTQGDKETDHTLYWEPKEWSNTLNTTLTTTTHYKAGKDTITGHANGQAVTVAYSKITQTLAIKTRELGPKPAGQEHRGNDVKMLEQMLWQLGLSPSPKPGIGAIRLNKDKREVFNAYDGNIKDKEGVENNNNVGKMMGRFNYVSHWPVVTTTEKQGFVEATVNNVQYQTLDELKKHWLHYMQAYESSGRINRFTFENLTEDEKNAAEKVFDGELKYPRGATITGIDATYDAKLHANVSQYGDFKRVDILKAMAQQEARGRHWAYKEGEDDHHRITVGGADEAGSKGFNQIQNKYVYGGLALDGTGNNKPNEICAPVSAYNAEGESQVNHYDPAQNLVAKAVWLVGTQGNCGRSFRRAFHDNSYTGTYQSAGATPLVAIQTGTIKDKLTSGVHSDDTYELLVKAIGAYNQGAGIFNGGKGNAWVGLLVNQMTLTSSEYKAIVEKKKKYAETGDKQYRPTSQENLDYGRTTAMVYGIKVMHESDKLGLPYRQYIWKGGTYAADLKDDKGNPDSRAGEEWCFGYGEEEWLAGKKFTDVKNAALDRNPDTNEVQTPQGRVTCTN